MAGCFDHCNKDRSSVNMGSLTNVEVDGGLSE